MRIYQVLISPRGVLGLTLLAFALAFVALLLDQADFKSPVLVYTFGVLAGIAALGALVAFFGPRIWPLLKEIKGLRLRWPFTLTSTSKPALKLSRQEIQERSIRYRSAPIRLVDLLEVVGVDDAIIGFTFEHCILEGPDIITFRGPPPEAARPKGTSAIPMVGPTDCRVEGAPETTLYEIDPGLKRLHGVVQLMGTTIRNVTFRNLGFAGTADELEWLKEHLTFSEGTD